MPRVLSELSAEDREALTLCDTEGLSQQAFADRLGLTLSCQVTLLDVSAEVSTRRTHKS